MKALVQALWLMFRVFAHEELHLQVGRNETGSVSMASL